ncbi:MAG: hypothetical protein JWN17_1573 [Frankiales bacterium]|nr:hypothetical protein [Frankiales bacterium]
MHDSDGDEAPADDRGLVVPSAPRSVAEMRHYAVRNCIEMGWGAHADTVALLVSEVAGNAVLHAYGQEVAVRVLLRASRLRVEVWDGSPRLPLPRGASERAENGRGLLILEALAAAWGVEARSDGKILWFELAD